jgi:hypothetical protein
VNGVKTLFSAEIWFLPADAVGRACRISLQIRMTEFTHPTPRKTAEDEKTLGVP